MFTSVTARAANPTLAGRSTKSSSGTRSIGSTTAFDRRTAVRSFHITARIAFGVDAACSRFDPLVRGLIVHHGEVHVLERRRHRDRAVHGHLARRQRGDDARDHRPVVHRHVRAAVGRSHREHTPATRRASRRGRRRPARRGRASTSRPFQISPARSAGAPNASRCPRWSTAMRSARRPASPRKCVHSTTVRPCSAASVPMRSMTSRVASGSSPRSARRGTARRGRAAAPAPGRPACAGRSRSPAPMVGAVGHAEPLEHRRRLRLLRRPCSSRGSAR